MPRPRTAQSAHVLQLFEHRDERGRGVVGSKGEGV
jgi:hypothetical protein